MPGSHVTASQLVRPLRQDAELEQGIAHHARVGRAPATVFIDKIFHDGLPEAFSLVGDVVFNTHAGRQLAGFVGFIAPHPHGEPYNFIALLFQHKASGGAVYAAAHAYQYSLFGVIHKSSD